LTEQAASVVESVLKRDRTIIALALITLTALAWAYLVQLNRTMAPTPAMPDMPGMANMPGMNMGAAQPFAPLNLALTFAMWATMMVGMMIPSAAPMILLYARVGRQARAQGKLFAAAGWFAGGYIAAWTAFAAVASLSQAALARAALITPMLVATNNLLIGSLLLVAGLYQWLPVKDACLAQCQAPLAFLQRMGGFKRDIKGSFTLGARHGIYCIGCCWALMALLFVGGVMNLLWIAALSIFVLVEKLGTRGRLFTRTAGLVSIALGSIYVARTIM
jgi:predicted metal-binding membrane protein